MRVTRISKIVGAAAIAALALSACGGNTGGGNNAASGSSTSSGGGQITVAEVNGFSSFNQSTANGNSDINGKIWYSTHAGFNYISKDLEVVKNEKFGKYEKVSDDPLTVKYTINDGVKWSDGTPVTADDYVLAWAVYSGWYDDATLDPNSGEVTKGNQYFEYAGTTLGLNNSKFPTISEDKKSFTIEYTVPYADWEIAFNAPEVPAHVVAKKSGLADANALTSLFKSMKKGDKASPAPKNAQLQKVADFYNKGFDSTSLPSDPSLYLSNGPFVVSSITDGESVTLKKNPDYTWGTPAKVDTIVMRTIGDTQAQVQALKNGEVDIAAPQASADTLTSLEEIQGAQIQKGDQLAYDHLDLNYSGVFADKNVRDAFMKTVPRKQIVEGILTKMKPDAKILDSQLFVPAQDGYEKAAQENGSQNYQDVDIEGAKKLLAGKTPTVRIMYNKDNPNRVDAYTLIAQSATQAGFKIVNNGAAAKEWSGKLGDGTYDATIFGWTNPGVGVVGTSQIFGTGQSSNFNKFSSPEADKLMSELNKTTDDAKKTELQQQIDKLIWDSKYGLPLFQSYGVEAFSDRVTGGVNYNPQQYGVWWDVWDWQLK